MLKRKSDEIAIVSNSNDKGILTTTKATTSNINSVTTAHTSNALFKPIKRTSPLQSQIMQLSAHSAPVLTCKFQTNETGKQWIASGGFDGSISTLLYNIVLWNAWDEVQNWGVMKNVEPVLDLVWGRDGTTLFSCSSDTTISHWDISSGTKTRRFKGHKAIVNAISTPKRGQDLVASVSDDGLCKVWDQRAKDPVKSRDVGYPLLATSFSRDGDIVFIGTKPQLTKGGVNNEILAWDLKLDKQIYALSGHVDSITGIHLLTQAWHYPLLAHTSYLHQWIIPFVLGTSDRFRSIRRDGRRAILARCMGLKRT